MLYKRNPQLNKHGELIHLLSTEGLPKNILTHILDTATNFVSRQRPRSQKGAACCAARVCSTCSSRTAPAPAPPSRSRPRA